MNRQNIFIVCFSLIACLSPTPSVLADEDAQIPATEQPSWLEYARTGNRPGMIDDIDPRHSALVIVDIQDMTMTDVALKNIEMPDEDRLFHRQRMHETVLPNLNRLVHFFRSHNMAVVYICLGGEPPYRDLPTPLSSEKVLNKPRTGAFAGTDLHEWLQARDIDTLFVTGTDTSACVLVTGYGACDRGYQLVLVEDATISTTPVSHEIGIGVWALMATIHSTERVISDYPWSDWVNPADPTPAAMRRSIEENIVQLPDPKSELASFKTCTANLLSNYSLGKVSDDEFTQLWYGLDGLARKYYYEDLTQKMQTSTFKAKFANPAQ